MTRYLVFTTAALSLFMYAIDSTVVAVAFPSFTAELHSTVLWSAWTISIFFIAVTMAMPLAGSLGDSFGRKKLFLASLALFSGSSLACGLAPNIYALIAFRFVQGLGGACFLPTASGIVSDRFPENRDTVIGLMASIYSIGAVIGPNLGGWIVARYSWRYIFYINVPIGVLLMASASLLLSDSRAFSRPRVDFAGVAFMSGSVLFFMLGLNSAADHLSAAGLGLSALFVAASAVMAFLFLKREGRAEAPILDVAMLRSAPFVAANVTNLVLGMTMIGVFSFIPLYATSVFGLSTLASGMILTPRSFSMAVVAAVTSFFLKSWGYRWPMVAGFVVIAATTALLAPAVFPVLPWGTVGTLSVLMFLNGIGGGTVFPASNNACIELLPEKVGTIVGVRNTFRNLGAALGATLVTFILNVSGSAEKGFTIAFIFFGLTFIVTVPLLFLMPPGGRLPRP